MRKSVLTGIFACTLIFVAQVERAEAIEIASEKTNETTTSLVNIETMNETTVSPLLLMTEVKEEVVILPEEKKPTIHTVAENETLSNIAKLYNTTWEKIYSKNIQLENPNIVNPGIQLTIPEVDEVVHMRPIPVVAPKPAVITKSSKPKTTNTPTVTSSRGTSSGNGYVAGYCTWYVKNRRSDIPNNLGNASTWVSRAASQGMATGSVPKPGAVGQRGNHVVYVETVNDDGTVTISEMNHKGLYVHTVRTVPASYFSYIY
jgi:surface antigen